MTLDGTRSLIPAPDITGAVVAPTNEAAQAFLQEAKGLRETPTKLAIITIEHKKNAFKMPSGDLAESVSGYPIYYFQTRRFYKLPPQAGQKGTPPDCWSSDLLVPHQTSVEQQAETCAECVQNQWGTARDGRSKGCGTYTWVFLLNPAFGSPPLAVLVAPPSSIRALLGTRFQPGYLNQCVAKHGCYEIVWTRFGLEAHGTGAEYSTLVPEMGEAAKLETARKLASIRNQFLEAMNEMRLRVPEQEGHEEGD
jgi:hypothetical protein